MCKNWEWRQQEADNQGDLRATPPSHCCLKAHTIPASLILPLRVGETVRSKRLTTIKRRKSILVGEWLALNQTKYHRRNP